LQSDRKDSVINPNVEGRISSTVRIQPREPCARNTRSPIRSKSIECAANKNLAVRLQSDGFNGTVRVWIERLVNGAVGIKARDAIARD
jgi:hypothetical protein